MSQRALQRKRDVTWRTVRRTLDGKWPEPRRQHRRRESRLDPCKPLIDEILRADPDAPAKQRHTAQRIFDRLTFNGAIIVTPLRNGTAFTERPSPITRT
ncbi:hypothetical protein ABT099_26615 [Streptomyces prasinus]|uniref:hypothetical protein n=1 Tax=Streptomyces prasinus TaxID=67345 RepID=UPI0033214FF0